MSPYPRLFSEWTIRNTTVANRVVFAPTCPTWVADPLEGVFTDQAVAYYEERAKAGCGLIIIGGTIIHREALYSEFNFPGLWNDEQVEGFAKVAEAVHRHGCKLATQLLHVGLRATPVLKKDPAYDPDAEWYLVAPSQVPPGEYPNAPMPKELEEHEIEELLDAFAEAGRRAIAAGLDGVEFHMSHGYLPWQFLSPLYNHRTDGWGGSYENRLRFPLEALHRIRAAIGEEPFLGYRINSTSFWPGDLELEDVKRIVGDLEAKADVDYVNLSAGVHHSYIHTPMTYEPGWERGYTKAVKEVSTKPVLLVGRITNPEIAEEILEAGEADAILLARQYFADAEWAKKAMEGKAEDIRRCVAANYCWRSVIRGGRVQCVYNPEVGRERQWGAGTLVQAADPKRVLVLGAGPAGLELARIAAARGHDVLVLEREAEVGGHVRWQSLLPGRAEYFQIAAWLRRQAEGNGAQAAARRGGDGGVARHGAGGGAARSRRRRDRLDLSPRRLAGPDGPAAARLGDRQLRHVGRGRDRRRLAGRRRRRARRPPGRRRAADGGQARAGGVRREARHPLAHGRDGDDPGGLLPLDPPAADRDGRRARDRPVREGDPRLPWSSCSTSTRRSGRWSSMPTGS